MNNETRVFWRLLSFWLGSHRSLRCPPALQYVRHKPESSSQNFHSSSFCSSPFRSSFGVPLTSLFSVRWQNAARLSYPNQSLRAVRTMTRTIPAKKKKKQSRTILLPRSASVLSAQNKLSSVSRLIFLQVINFRLDDQSVFY